MSNNGVSEEEYCLSCVTEEVSEHTGEDWDGYLAGVDDKVDPTRYRSRLRELRDYAASSQVKSAVPRILALVKDGSLIADAVLEISHIEHGKDAPRKKVLDICLHPRFDLDGYNEVGYEFFKDYSSVARGSIVCSLELIFGEDPANEIKLFGRTESMYGYFQAIASEIAESGGIEGLAVFCQGRWLVFKKEI